MKQFFYLLTFLLLSTVTSAQIQIQNFSGGRGYEDDPYQIETVSDLILMRDFCGDINAGKHFRLMNDIQLNSVWGAPIGNASTKAFTGYFHGGGNTISGLQMDNDDYNFIGLFGYNKGTIDSLYITKSDKNVGTVGGGSGEYAGGLVGYNAGTITFCHTYVDVNANSFDAASYAGGLAGYNTGVIQSSSAEGNVTATGSTKAYSGGLVGYNTNSIKNCFAKGKATAGVYGGISYAGGLVGYHSSTITDCYTIGKPSARGGNTQYEGAVIGYNSNGNITRCYYNFEITGNIKSVGNDIINGTVYDKTTAGMQARDVYVGWDFNSVWGIRPNEYPYLRDIPLELKEITVSSGNLTPAFDLNTVDTINYITDIDVTTIDINATSSIGGATIKGTGNNIPLIAGNNRVPVTVTHDGGSLVYMINVHSKYTLTFDPNGGELSNNNTKTITSGINKLPVPTRPGYDFKEWNTLRDRDSIVYDDLTVQYASWAGVSNPTLYAKWMPRPYTVKFNAPGSNETLEPITVTYGNPVGELPVPTRTGYNFKAWNIVPEEPGVIYTKDTVYRISSDTTLYVRWEPKSYKIHFDINYSGGPSLNDKSVEYNTAVGTLERPEQKGYTFKGWNTDRGGNGITYTETTVYTVDHETTLYAQWTANKYTLYLDVQGKGTTQNPVSVTYDKPVGELLHTLDNIVHDNIIYYYFTGWNTKPDGSGDTYTAETTYQIDKDTTVYAQWKGEKYQLSFLDNDERTLFPNQDVYYGEKVGNLPKPLRTGYTDRWNTQKNGGGKQYDETTLYEVSGSTKLYAIWTPITYTLKYDINGGTGVTPDHSSVMFDSPVGSLPDPTPREGYKFKEWNTKPDGNGTKYTAETIYQIDKDTTIYAQWTGRQYTITYNPEGGSLSQSLSRIVTMGNAIGEFSPNPTLTGYAFDGWYTEKGGGGTKYEATTIYNDVNISNLYAKWTPKEYTLSYNKNYSGNDGSGPDPVSKKVIYGIEVGTLSSNITRTNYTFKGWNTKADGTGEVYTETTVYLVEGTTVLYAQWQGIEYTLTLNANYTEAPIVSVTHKVYYGAPIGVLPAPSPARPGYSLTSWTTEPGGGGITYNSEMLPTQGVTLYAQWTPKEYTLSFDPQGGNVNSKIVVYNAKVGDLPVPIAPNGYYFGGWYSAANGKGTLYDENTFYKVANNSTLHAYWIGNEYTLSFDFNCPPGENCINSNGTSLKVIYGSAVGELPGAHEITCNNYDLKIEGTWNTEKDGSGTTYTKDTPYTIKPDHATLYAQWEGKICTLKFIPNPPNTNSKVLDNDPTSIEVRYGSAIGKFRNLPNPKCGGYSFIGWKDGNGKEYTKETICETLGTIDLYAQWEDKKYTIYFNTNYSNGGGDSIYPKSNLVFGEPIGILAEPKSDSDLFTFGGWNTRSDGSGDFVNNNAEYRFYDDINLYAIWLGGWFTISFEVDELSETLETLAVRYYSQIGNMPTVLSTTPGYKFNGWKDREGKRYTSTTYYRELSNITLYPVWAPITYTLSFNPQGGYIGSSNEVYTTYVDFDSIVTYPPVPTRAGYRFDAWYTEPKGAGYKYEEREIYQKPGNTIVHANWIPINYTLSLNALEDTDYPKNNLSVEFDSSITLPVPKRPGYRFDKWNTAEDGSGISYSGTITYTELGDMTLYAQWIQETYTVTFHSRNGIGDRIPTSKSVHYNETITLPTLTDNNYDFKNWNTEEYGTGVSLSNSYTHIETKNVILYAQWTGKRHTLMFDAGEGTVTPNSKTVYFNSEVGKLPEPVREGYSFIGWYAEESGMLYLTSTKYSESGNTTLVADWKISEYTLSFNANYVGRESVPSKYVKYGSPVGELPVPVRLGHTFEGWNTETDGNGITYSPSSVYSVARDITLYAQWTADTYLLGFEANYTGSVVKPGNPAPQNVIYGSVVGTLPVPERMGYVFTGWNTAENGNGSVYTETTIYTITDNTTLYAQWKIIKYTVSFTGIEVSVDPQNDVLYGQKAVCPTSPTRLGYVFGGWYNKNNDLWDFNNPVMDNMVLTAKWLSENALLKSLTISKGTLSPEFQPSVVENNGYTVTVSHDVATISVKGIAQSSGARVVGNVEEKVLAVGPNVIRIDVLAEDEIHTSRYEIVVTREDHIRVHEAIVSGAMGNGRAMIIKGNTIEYPLDCEETSFALDLQVSPYSTVTVDGEQYRKGQIIETGGQDKKTNIHIVSETGETADYTLNTNTAIKDQNKLYYQRWDIFGINANPENNGGHDILPGTTPRWYDSRGSYLGEKNYVQMESGYTYVAEIQTVKLAGWRRVCGSVETLSTDKVIAYPNPVPYGESLKLELPDEFIGGTLNIYDVKGSLHKSKLPLPGKVNSIDVSSFGSGMYLLDITGKDGSRWSVKMIVE
jgi:uncharacterized repeat protein (TIGR02543 family)